MEKSVRFLLLDISLFLIVVSFLRTNMPYSRFPEIVDILHVYSREIRGRINTLTLSQITLYAELILCSRWLLLINMSRDVINRYQRWPLYITNISYLEPYVRDTQYNNKEGLWHASVRNDGWLEIQIGDFFISGLKVEELHMRGFDERSLCWRNRSQDQEDN